MQQELLPLFPLQVVLFPRTPLPLHIFEERYKEMIGLAIENRTEFGVVLAGEKGVASTGCTAIVERVVERHGDGRIDLITGGKRRFEIESIDQELSYLRGTVEFFDDDFGDVDPPAELRLRVLEAYQSLVQADWQPALEDRQLSFQLAHSIVDLSFRQKLLGLRSEAARLRQLVEFLPSYSFRKKHEDQITKVAPRNGHAKHVGFE